MTIVALITALALVLAVAIWRISDAAVKIHEKSLDHRHRTAAQQMTADEDNHRRWIETRREEIEPSADVLACRTAEAEAKTAQAQAKAAEARERETRETWERRYR